MVCHVIKGRNKQRFCGGFPLHLLPLETVLVVET
ncbi:unnamed protein product [Brassica rapa subsp. trilocularis]